MRLRSRDRIGRPSNAREDLALCLLPDTSRPWRVLTKKPPASWLKKLAHAPHTRHTRARAPRRLLLPFAVVSGSIPRR